MSGVTTIYNQFTASHERVCNLVQGLFDLLLLADVAMPVAGLQATLCQLGVSVCPWTSSP
ncbi:hypothetical protein [Marinobacter panjinensis]|uniref:hypothetical protein n=1 Tax=Marinobacter panjinensis TaxID=2576384 RepID=UPI00148591C9|nr:hypothetical protein [Marinobacter panjinensis]MCR8916010.1 hypothetical protein [Marinobacter panjinensis]